MEFPTTRWDDLAQASLCGDTAARQALDRFCQRYWEPVNAFLRWKGCNEADAADVTQDFFLNFIENRSWRRADPLRGSFRTFLLGALTHRLQKAHIHGARLKRGGGVAVVSLEAVESENAATEFPTVAPADAAHFDRAWGLRLLAAALARTREVYAAGEKERLYEGLKPFLGLRRQPLSYEETAKALGLSLGAVKTEIHRLRQAFRAALRAEIAQTVSAPHEIDAELRHLRAVLATQELDSDATGET
jgi:DNA-directed RNA polymerase specialized sigma24 family protein